MLKPGSWPSIGLIYVYGVLAAASLSKIIPLQEDFARHVGVGLTGFALLISLLSVPAALCATLVGSVIDRVGSRGALIAAAAAGALANLLYLQVEGERGFQAVRLFEGLVMVGVYSAAPALIMATTSSERRGRAMAIWSTYTPVGVSFGLLLASLFAGTAHWRGGYAVHAALFATMAAAGLLLARPVPMAHSAPRRSLAGMLEAFTQPGPLRVALVFATLVLTGLGTNTVFPAWYAGQHSVSLGAASGIMGVANLTMIAGGVLAAILLARGFTHRSVFTVLAGAGVVAAAAVFWPGIATTSRIAALVAWFVVSGGCVAATTAMLPRVVASPQQGAAAAGLLSQLAAATTFVTPLLWAPLLARGHWLPFVALVAAAALAGIALFPRRRHAVR